MKLSKLMLSAFTAAMVLISCNKSETTPMSGNLKSVEISLENVEFITKGAGISEDLKNTELKLNTVQLFFTDGTNIYTPKTADGKEDAKTYLNAADITGGNLAFHYLPAAVNRVVAVGNQDMMAATSLSALNFELDIDTQQDPYDLTLFAEGAITQKKAEDHNSGTNAHETDVYTVHLSLAPRIARFEINGIQCNFSNPALYSSIEIHQIAFADYFQFNNSRTNTNTTVRAIDMQSLSTIFSYLNSKTVQAWHNDLFNDSEVLKLTPDSVESAKADVNLAYNFFPGVGAYPRFVLNLTTDGTLPAYIATSKFRMVDGTELQAKDFKSGYIYRIESFAFSDTDLTHQERCVEITLSVVKWNVVTVIPEF